MPLIDSDMIIGYMKEGDRLQEYSQRLFNKIIIGKLEAYVSSSMFIEVAFVLKRNDQLDSLSEVNTTSVDSVRPDSSSAVKTSPTR